MFKLQGTLKVLNPTVQVSEKFAKREFVVTDTSSMYPQDIQFQLTQDKCSLIDGFNVGDHIDVSFNIKGRLWQSPQGEDKYFNTLEAWKLDKVNGAPTIAPQPQAIPQASNEPEQPLPF